MGYKYRGIITAFFCFLLLLLPSASIEALGISFFIAILFFIAAFSLRIWARMCIGEHSRGSELACPKIVNTGPYKYIKHPLYLSNFMAGVAFALFHAGFSLGMLCICSVYAVFLAILAIKENKFIKQPPESKFTIQPLYFSIKQTVKNDIPTWFWQIVIIILIFLIKKP